MKTAQFKAASKKAPRRAPHRMTVIAHRGARSHAPENSLAAFERAIVVGAPWIELDVQLHDGKLWVFHDRRLERCTGARGTLSDLPSAALRKLDLGGGQRIPYLAEALDRIDARCALNIELKTAGPTAAAVAAVLRKCLDKGWPADKLMVSSFHLRQLREFRRRLPEIPLGALFCGVPLDLAAAAAGLGAAVVAMDADFADPALIADAHARGMKAWVYTVNEPDDIERFRALGVDGIFTDFPERALPR